MDELVSKADELPVEVASRLSDGLGSTRAEELRVLVEGLERLLKLHFPAHDSWNSGQGRWERDREKAIHALLKQIESAA